MKSFLINKIFITWRNTEHSTSVRSTVQHTLFCLFFYFWTQRRWRASSTSSVLGGARGGTGTEPRFFKLGSAGRPANFPYLHYCILLFVDIVIFKSKPIFKIFQFYRNLILTFSITILLLSLLLSLYKSRFANKNIPPPTTSKNTANYFNDMNLS